MDIKNNVASCVNLEISDKNLCNFQAEVHRSRGFVGSAHRFSAQVKLIIFRKFHKVLWEVVNNNNITEIFGRSIEGKLLGIAG